jgi:crotonobetainyl-CoA:carnitine CoA-transferase CaiB-like acyl-CoA transferase
MLDWSANGRVWQRYGNRSPYKTAAPHGAFRCVGEDRWLAVACFDEADWQSLTRVAGHPEWASDARFATLQQRLLHQDALEALIASWLAGEDAFATMQALQAAGVAAGVCQTCEDRCDADPQLAALEWLTEIPGTKIGTWPLADFPAKLSRTPGHVGGLINRGAPGYGEDNDYVLGELLGLSQSERERLAADGVI